MQPLLLELVALDHTCCGRNVFLPMWAKSGMETLLLCERIKSGECTDGYGMFIWIYKHYGVCIESTAPSAVCKERCEGVQHLTLTSLSTNET